MSTRVVVGRIADTFATSAPMHWFTSSDLPDPLDPTNVTATGTTSKRDRASKEVNASSRTTVSSGPSSASGIASSAVRSSAMVVTSPFQQTHADWSRWSGDPCEQVVLALLPTDSGCQQFEVLPRVDLLDDLGGYLEPEPVRIHLCPVGAERIPPLFDVA